MLDSEMLKKGDKLIDDLIKFCVYNDKDAEKRLMLLGIKKYEADQILAEIMHYVKQGII